MTITLTKDWLVFFYWLVENYVFLRIQELKVQQYYAYYERLAEWVEDCSQPEDKFGDQPCLVETSFGQEPVLVPVVPMKPVVIQPELDEKAEGLFAELQLELGTDDSNYAVEVDIETNGVYELDDEPIEFGFDNDVVSLADYEEQEFMEDGTFATAYDEGLEDNQEDCIHMDDLMREVEVVSSPSSYEAFASAKIADCTDGLQQWVVSVIGMEEQYIHVSDGKRIWLNIGERASRIHKNDVLILDLIRHGKEVKVQNLVRVETLATDEYMIPDEEQFLVEEDVRIAI